MPLAEHVTKAEVEARLRLHRNTVTRLLAAGRFPNAFRAGGRWRIPVGDVEAFIRSGGTRGGPQGGGAAGGAGP